MASRDPIEVVKMSSNQNDTFEIKRNISDVTTPSDVEFDQPFSNFIVRFNHQVDTESSHFTVIISIRNKQRNGTFDASVELERGKTKGVYEDKQFSVSLRNCTLVVHSDHSPGRITADIIVKISNVRSVLKTESAISEYTATTSTSKVYARQKKLTKDLYDNRQSTGDVTIVTARGTMYKAHKLILGAQSPCFKTMFEVDLKERKESKVKIDKFEADLVVGLIEFMYVGWTVAVETNPEGLLEIAHMYQVADLVEACWDSLIKTLDVKTAVKLFRLSGKFDDEDGLYKMVIGQFLFKKFASIRMTEEFAAFVKEDVDRFLKICRFSNFWNFNF